MLAAAHAQGGAVRNGPVPSWNRAVSHCPFASGGRPFYGNEVISPRCLPGRSTPPGCPEGTDEGQQPAGTDRQVVETVAGCPIFL